MKKKTQPKKSPKRKAPAKAKAKKPAAPPPQPPLLKWRLKFTDGIAPHVIEAVDQDRAEKAGRRLSANFAFAEQVAE